LLNHKHALTNAWKFFASVESQNYTATVGTPRVKTPPSTALTAGTTVGRLPQRRAPLFVELSPMSLWDLIYYGWFAFMGMSIFAVIGAAIYDSRAAKRRQAKAQASAKESETAEEPQSEAEEAGAEEASAEEQAIVEETPDAEPDPLAGPDDFDADSKPADL
jgi:hypothetical protein